MSETTTPAEAQEIEATEEYGTATLAGVELRVKSQLHWRPSHMRALRGSDFETWAAGVLHEDDVETFIDLDATFGEIFQFVSDAAEAVGEPVGKSTARARSSRTTRKR
ncbi:hypothetical protein J7I94_19080 [Streptomyces sp. ISL-12]|uniref:hypothetical protein n=1 Tax=Streptomyces sp. ISL-12 TaxID=2819177 RepID=UPI001BE81DD4|nr:hypothetical protein [Streptomyces sp. ISL-12]MBT2412638.1 hypothetical protein [Streptomyces sp. ISL-12]